MVLQHAAASEQQKPSQQAVVTSLVQGPWRHKNGNFACVFCIIFTIDSIDFYTCYLNVQEGW